MLIILASNLMFFACYIVSTSESSWWIVPYAIANILLMLLNDDLVKKNEPKE